MKAGRASVTMVLACLVSGDMARSRHSRGERGGGRDPGDLVNSMMLGRHNYRRVTGLPGAPGSPRHLATEGGPWPSLMGGDEERLGTGLAMGSLDIMLEDILLRRQRQLKKKARKLRRSMVNGDLIPYPRTG